MEKIKTTKSQHSKTMQRTLDMAYIAVFAVIIALSSWISIPMTVPFTMQTFGVFCALGLLGGKRGTISICIYVLLGLIGVPVFAGFASGAGVLFGTTGGYIIGFILSGLIFWLITHFFGKKTYVIVMAMLIGLIVCYAFGTAWFMMVYAKNTGAVGIATALGWCVLPFIIPDILKIALAIVITKTVPKYVKIFN